MFMYINKYIYKLNSLCFNKIGRYVFKFLYAR